MDLPDISLCLVEYFFVFLPYSSLNLRQKLPFPYLMIIFLCLLGTENQCEADTDGKGIAGKDKPAGRPVADSQRVIPHLLRMGIDVDDSLCCQRPYRRTDAVCHQHEQSLCRRTECRLRTVVHEQRARDVEEVEGNAVDYHRQHEEQHTWKTRVAHTEQSETQHPCEHGYQHDILDAVVTHEERNQQDAAGLTDL